MKKDLRRVLVVVICMAMVIESQAISVWALPDYLSSEDNFLFNEETDGDLLDKNNLDYVSIMGSSSAKDDENIRIDSYINHCLSIENDCLIDDIDEKEENIEEENEIKNDSFDEVFKEDEELCNDNIEQLDNNLESVNIYMNPKRDSSAIIDEDGGLWLWGDNSKGQIGDGTKTDRSVPIKILRNVKMMRYGGVHSAAIKKDGSLWMWGNNSDGEIGDGTTTEKLKPVKVLEDVKYVSLGSYTSAAIKEDGSLWMWGDNSKGQIGDGTKIDKLSPVKIMDDVQYVCLEKYFSGAIKKDGTLLLWGDNSKGQIGDGTTTEKLKPVSILENVSQVSFSSSNYTANVGAIKVDKSLWMWGSNSHGEIGDGTTTGRNRPVQVLDNVKTVSLEAGSDGGYCGATKEDGSLWMWGWNYHGQVGDGTTTDRVTPIKILDNVKSYVQGMVNSGAIKEDDSLWTWGCNTSGELGDGSTTTRTSPTKIIENVKCVTFGWLHTGAIKKDGSLWMWGNNVCGQLGDGTKTSKLSPVKIDLIEDDITTVIDLDHEGEKTITFKSSYFSKPSGDFFYDNQDDYYSPEISELSICMSTMICGSKKSRIVEQFKKLGFNLEDKNTNDFVSRHYYPDEYAKKKYVTDTQNRGNYSPAWIVDKKIRIDNTQYRLLCVVLEGTAGLEWIDNFDAGKNNLHLGFDRAANHVADCLNEYVDDLKNSGADENIKILVTGHSRGAAVANLIGKKLDDKEVDKLKNVNSKDIYVYTYATPNVTNVSYRSFSKYNNIFNIVNPEDFVTKVLPTAWGYGRFGITYVLPSSSFFSKSLSGISSYYYFANEVSKRVHDYRPAATDYSYYDPYDNGMWGVTRYIDIITIWVNNVEEYYNKPLSIVDVSRPMYSPKSELYYSVTSLFRLFTESVAYYTAGEGIDDTDLRDRGKGNIISAGAYYGTVGFATESFFWYNGDFTKQFHCAHCPETYMAMLDVTPKKDLILPKVYNFVRVNCPVDILVKDGEDNILGKVVDNNVETTTDLLAMKVEGDSKTFIIPPDSDYTIELTGNDQGVMDYSICEYDADIGEISRVVYQNLPLKLGASYVQNLSGYENAEEAPLFDENSNVIKKTLEIDENNLGSLSVNVIVEGAGTAVSYESVTPGDYVVLTATPSNSNNSFIGWYDKDGNLISSDEEYGFSVKKSEDIIAKFTNNPDPSTEYYSVDVSVEGAGTAVGHENVSPGEYVVLTATPKNEYNHFVGWYDKDGNLLSTNSEYGLYVNKNEEFIAKFTDNEEPQESLSVNVIVRGAGTVASYENVTPGDYVVLKATPNNEYNTFIGWFDLDGNLISTDSEYGLYVTKNEEFIAKFTDNEEPKESLSVNVIIKGAGRAESHENIIPGDYVVLKATPKNGYNKFIGWYDKDGNLISADNEYGIYVTKNEEFIAKFTDNDAGLWIETFGSEQYTGSPIQPELNVYDGEKLLNEKTDYTVEYKNNKKVYTLAEGDAGFDPKKAPSIIVTGKGNYDSKETVYFKILPPDIGGREFSADDITLAVTGRAQKVAPELYWNGKKLKNKKDYTFAVYKESDKSFSKPLGERVSEAGNYVVRLTGNVNFIGTRDVNLNLTSDYKLVNTLKIGKVPAAKYTGSAIKPEPEVRDGNTILTKDEHYTLSYDSNVNAGTGYVIIKGIPEKGYAGCKRIGFKIKGPKSTKASAYDISETKDTEHRITVTCEKSVPFMKGGAEPAVTVFYKDETGSVSTLIEGRDYNLKYKNNKTIGGSKKPAVEVSGTGNFKGKRECPFTIEEKNIGLVTLLADDVMFKNKTNSYAPKLTLTDEDGKALKSGKDYEKEPDYSYVNDTKVTANGSSVTRSAGEAVDKGDIIPAGTVIKAVVKAKAGSGYTGSVSGEYKISNASIASAKVSIPVQIYTGKPITLSKNIITVDVKGQKLSDTDYEIVGYSNNTNKGTAKVTLRGIGNYGGLKTQTFKIKAKGFRWWWRK